MVAKPTRVWVVIIADSILLPPVLYMAVSMFFHLRSLNASSNTGKMNAIAENARRWMGRGVMASLTFGVLFYIGSYMMNATVPSELLCHIADTFWGFVYGGHKLGMYTFIYFRVSTFSDFFSDRTWKFLRVFGILMGMMYIGVILVIMVSYRFDPWILSEGFCEANRLRNTSNLIIGGFLLFLDLCISGVGIVCFVRLLWCNSVLGQIAKKDPKVGESARNVVKWSFAALVSTLSMLMLTIAFNNFAFIDWDVFVNCLCLCMQYPKALVTLLELVFGWNSTRHELDQMNTVDPEEAV